MRLINGCGGRLKSMRLTARYTLNSEVRLTTGVYSMGLGLHNLSLVPRPRPEKSEEGLVTLAPFPVTAESAVCDFG